MYRAGKAPPDTFDIKKTRKTIVGHKKGIKEMKIYPTQQDYPTRRNKTVNPCRPRDTTIHHTRGVHVYVY